MSNSNSQFATAQARLQQAEALARENEARSPNPLAALSPEAAREMLHDLQVHQIELEMQNQELRQTQLQLDTARARYFDLYDLAPVGYCTVSEQGLILEANITLATLLGVARRDLIGQPFSHFIVRAYRDHFHFNRKQLFAAGQPQTCELQLLKADRAPCWVKLSTTLAEEDSDAAVQRIVLTDTTAQKLLALAMHDSEGRYRAMLEWSPGAIFVHRLGKIIYANAAAVRLFGAASSSELVGSALADRIHPDYRELVIEHRQSIATAHVPTAMLQSVFIKLDGSLINVEAQGISTIFEGGPAFQVALSDVTERTQIDKLLQEKNLELERARASAEKANQAKSEFLSSMSHELRSPLNAILGFAQLLQADSAEQTASQKESTGQILQAGWYLLELINEILDLALIESGKLQLCLDATSLDDALLDCQDMIEPQAAKAGIQVRFCHFDQPCLVHADYRRMKQVLINLLTNAIKYNHAGGTVTVDCTERSAERIRISVGDTGPGLSAEHLAQLFQPFNRLGQESSGEEGTGIGLVMTKRLVELMGGEIGVESTLGKGSVFWFELIRIAGSEDANTNTNTNTNTNANANASEAREVAADPGLRTLLYVEDNPANLKLVESLIARRPNLRLLSAGDAAAGIQLARDRQPEVILMDINLPGISGVTALKLLREDALTRHITVVAISANAMPRDVQTGMEAGFFRYLTKPIRVDEFMDTLDLALAHAKSISDSTAASALS